MHFANPWGLLALLGIPAVLIIHALRRNPKSFVTNTLFLIDAKLRDPGGGRRLRRLRRSAQLWIRLLLVCVIAWVLARPVTLREDSTQRIVLVIDASASMSAAQQALVPALRASAEPWIKQTAHTEWIVLSSLPDAPPIHRGWDNFDTLLETLEDWRPLAGNHDPGKAIDLAQGLAADHGRVIFISDQPLDPLPDNLGLIAIGAPIDNVGWCGLDIDGDGNWKAILRNFGTTAQRRTLTQAGSADTEIDLAPGEWRNLEGTLPAGTDAAAVTLTEDKFPLDDTLHLVRPSRKPFTWSGTATPEPLVKLFTAIDLKPSATGADLEVRSNDLAPAASSHSRLLLPGKPSDTSPYVKVPATATVHPFCEGLMFDGLLWRSCAPLNPPASGDTVLLWSGENPVAILRNGGRDLEFGFHPEASNFSRVAPALILVQRWIDYQRGSKVAPASVQLSTADRFQLAADPIGGELTLTSPQGKRQIPAAKQQTLIAPEQPGTLTITQGETTLLSAAVNFVDPIESNFAAADTASNNPPAPTALIAKSQRPDRFRDLWLLIALILLLLTWLFPETAPKSKTSAANPTTEGITV